MSNNNILITGINTSHCLCSVTTIVWHWNSLLRGEDLGGKHFDDPLDGLYSSWHGHRDAPLKDTFLGLSFSPIPKPVVQQVHQILNLHPNGISLSCLQTKLEKAGICLDKYYYGYKNFS